MSAPHILVVAPGDDKEGYPNYDIECPGVGPGCEAYFECRPCTTRAATDVDFDHELHDDGEAHGKQHQKLMGVWMAESGTCLVRTHDYLWDAASDVTREPGRYPVTVEFEGDGEFMTLHPADEAAAR